MAAGAAFLDPPPSSCKAILPRGRSESMTEYGRERNADTFLQDEGFLQQATLARGLPIGLAETFLELSSI